MIELSMVDEITVKTNGTFEKHKVAVQKQLERYKPKYYVLEDILHMTVWETRILVLSDVC